MEWSGRLLGSLLIVVCTLCAVDFALSIQKEQELCASLCSRLSNDPTEENPQSLNGRKNIQDIVRHQCDCSKIYPSDFKRRRRSVATSKPQPTALVGNETNKEETAKNNTTTKDTKGNELPGVNVAKNIRFVNPSQDLSKFTLEQPSIIPTLPSEVLKHMFPHIYKATTYCNYSITKYDEDKEANEADDIQVVFRNSAHWLCNVTWQPPKDNDSNSDYLVLWNSQINSHDVPKIENNYVHCRKVSKNQTFTVIEEDEGWKYPQTIYLTVVTIPKNLQKSLRLKDFSPIAGPRIIPVPPKRRPKDSTLQNGSIAAGVISGVIIIAVFVILYRKKCGQSESPNNEIDITRQPFANNSDGRQRILNESKPKNIDVYFGSYLPESEKYSNEVATIAGSLRASGFRVIFDQVDSVELNSMGFNLWVEKQIMEAKKYIVFCSPGYVKLWQTLATNAQEEKLNHVNKEDLVRVRYEIKRITDIYSESCSTKKIICIKMDPKMSTKALPPWMNHNMLVWPEQKFDIIRRLNDQAAMVMDL